MTQDVFVTIGPTDPERDRSLAGEFGIDPEDIVRPVELATPRGILSQLRRRRIAKLILPAVEPQRTCTFVPLLAWILAARPRRILSPRGDDTWRIRTLPRFVIDSVPATLTQCVGAVLTLAAHGLVLRLARPRMKRRPIEGSVPRVAYVRTVPGYLTPAGGATTHAREVIRGLRQIGCEVTVREAIANPQPRETRESGQFGVGLASRLLPGFVAMGGDLTLLLRAAWPIRSTDLVYQRLTPCSTAALLLSALWGKPLVIEYNSTIDHDGSQAMLGRYERWAERLNLSFASRIVVISEVLREALIDRGIPEEKIVLNPNAVDPDRFQGKGLEARETLGFTNEDLVYGFVGSFGFWHGSPVLAEAFAQFAPEHPSARLLLVGDGTELPETITILDRAGLSDRIVFTGRVGAEDVPGLMEACDVLCSPHVPWPDGRPFHGSPTKLFEYMATGRAIVASRLGQISEVLDHEKTALLVRPGDSAELADALSRLYADSDLRTKLGKAARLKAEREHTWEKNAERIVAPG